MNININDKFLDKFIYKDDRKLYNAQAAAAYKKIFDKSGEGSDFLGWVNLPKNYINEDEYAEIKKTAETIKKQADVLLVIGIGGSYLGARAVIEFLKSPYYNNKKKDTPEIYFIGNSISSDSLSDVIGLCEDKSVAVNVISKSGRTLEPAIAFREICKYMESRFPEDYKDRIYVTTDKDSEKSALKKFAVENGLKSFTVPDDVGGRYSVLTPVGLLPIAVAGIDIDALMAGAIEMQDECAKSVVEEIPAVKYAVLRNIMHGNGKSIEVMTAYDPAFLMMNEWWKQLFGESEGKDKKGLFPASMIFSTDLHSLGQFVQDGSRIMFETVINIKKQNTEITIEETKVDIDKLNYLSGKSFQEINKNAMIGTIVAHGDGGTPNIIIEIEEKNEKVLGSLIYFFEFACAISGYMLGVNPFNQPGVEGYKDNMFALLGENSEKSLKIKAEIEPKIAGKFI